MKNRELIVPFTLKDGKSCDKNDALSFAEDCENRGADALYLLDLSKGDEEHDATIALIRQIAQKTDLSLYGGGRILRLEDVKKLIYAGCNKVCLDFSKETERELLAEAAARFGADRMIAMVHSKEELADALDSAAMLGAVFLTDPSLLDKAAEKSAGTDPELICRADGPYEKSRAAGILGKGHASIVCDGFLADDFAFMEAKYALKDAGIAVNCYEASLGWEELKEGPDGLLPVVVQDFKTEEVLMVAYMNEEAYNTTIRTGRMTYFSRSRQKLWVKGETSGHFQYLRELKVDCDNDTLLARVIQIGAACHTGNRSCFYRSILKKGCDKANPLNVFEDVYAVIEDRKENPKEGSYTNYLFDKGIDKILKKVGEEASEVVIAAKNPEQDELIYEIADLMYHLMVLMAERDLNWEDITEELARREN